jgi:uncharacterized membrane protein YbhN (UPF0104 family)
MRKIAVRSEHPRRPGDAPAVAIAAQSRTLRNGVLSLAVFCVMVVGVLVGVPGLRSAAEKITDANPLWVAGAVVLELLSCAAWVVLFQLVFASVARRLSSRLALSELAVNSVISLSGLGGLALGAAVLRGEGMSVEQLARRSVLIFVLSSAVNVAAVALIGVPMWLGLFAGSRRALLTLAPAGAAVATTTGVLALAGWARGASQRPGASRHRRLGAALAALGDGVADALTLLGQGDVRLLGAVGYWLFDNLALYACIAAFGHTHAPSFWAVAMAYLVGMMANTLPIPGGVVVVEGGLVGMLLLFGVRPASEVLAAVLIYRAVSLWIPALIGSAGFVSLRRAIGRTAVAAAPGSAGAGSGSDEDAGHGAVRRAIP